MPRKQRAHLASPLALALLLGLALAVSAMATPLESNVAVATPALADTLAVAESTAVKTPITDAQLEQLFQAFTLESGIGTTCACTVSSDCTAVCLDGGSCEAGMCSCYAPAPYSACMPFTPEPGPNPDFCDSPKCENFAQDCSVYCGGNTGGQCSPSQCCMC